MRVLSGLEPERVWKYFEDLCGIPHGSYNEKAVSDYCVAFARERGLEVYQDKAWNVVIIKEASAGYEEEEPLILQGHLDMVCVKTPDCDLDFKKDGLRLKAEGDYVSAKGTSLGGDDGIAVAYALALLDDDHLPHPRLEAVFTTAEEVGMDGATALDVSVLKGHTVLNLDSEEEGIFLAGCAGGCSAKLILPAKRESGNGIRAELSVHGLKGGHSGAEINKGRGNANVLLGLMLEKLYKELPGEALPKLVSCEGGEKDNAIPRESRAVLLFPDTVTTEQKKAVEQICADFEKDRKKQDETLSGRADENLKVTLKWSGAARGDTVSQEAFEALLAILTASNGVIRMSRDIPGLVQTSLNLGVLRSEAGELSVRYSIRSSVSEEKNEQVERLQKLAKDCGSAMEVNGDYPAWEYRKNSPFREECVRIYEEMFGRAPKVEVIHAGLECGILASKIPDLDCISMGPDMKDIHTTEERMNIASVERMWNFILEIVKRRAR